MNNQFENHEELKIFGEVFLHGSRGMLDRYEQGWIFTDHPLSKKRIVLKENTDWDYATQNVQNWQDLVWRVTKEGWEEVVDASYCDNDTAHVFEKIIDGSKVQVSLRQNLNRYRDVFNSVDTDFYFSFLWKNSPECLPIEGRREFWNSLYYAWDCGKGGV